MLNLGKIQTNSDYRALTCGNYISSVRTRFESLKKKKKRKKETGLALCCSNEEANGSSTDPWRPIQPCYPVITVSVNTRNLHHKGLKRKVMMAK